MKVSCGTFQCECDLKQKQNNNNKKKKKKKRSPNSTKKNGAEFLLYQTLCKSLEAAKDIRKHK